MEKFQLSESVQSIESSITFAIDAKVKELQKKRVKVYNLNLGEPDFPAHNTAKIAAIEAISDNQTKYTNVQGTLELRKAICEKFVRDNNLFYDPGEIIVSNGAKQALYLAIRTVCRVGDEIIVLAPYWTSYPDIVRLSGGKPVIVRSKDFRLAAKDIEAAITPKTKAVVINSPNNPTGIVYDWLELERLADLVFKHKILVVSDEIYEKFIYGPSVKHHSFASIYPSLKDYTLTINGVSKTYAMTGFRIGYGAGPEYIIEKMASLQSHVSSSACSISQAAAMGAISGDQDWVRRMVREFNRRRGVICAALRDFKIDYIAPEGAYYVFFRVEPKFNSIEFCQNLLDNFQVALNPGDTFGVPGWVRLSYTADTSDLIEAASRINAMLRSRS